MRLTIDQWRTLAEQAEERLVFFQKLADRVSNSEMIQDSQLFELAWTARNAVAKLAEDLRSRTLPGGKGQVYDQFDNGRLGSRVEAGVRL